MGGTVVAHLCHSRSGATDDLPGTPRHVLAPGQIQRRRPSATTGSRPQDANEQGVRLIIPLVDNWPWQGGRAEYAGFRGKTKDDFWTDPQLIADFEQTIRFILTRTNTITGVRYADDKAILCWETGNELRAPPSWTREIAALHQKPRHKSSRHGWLQRVRVCAPTSLEIPDVDIVTTHHYPGKHANVCRADPRQCRNGEGQKTLHRRRIRFCQHRANGRRHAGDHGQRLLRRNALEPALPQPRRRLLLAQRTRSGRQSCTRPFTGRVRAWAMLMTKSTAWTSSAATPSPFAACPCRQFPFPLRRNCCRLPTPPRFRGKARSARPAIRSNARRTPNGRWHIIADAMLTKAFTQYRPLFSDETVPAGNWYYRVRAKNDSGISEPSNVVGPVKVDTRDARGRTGGLLKKSRLAQRRLENRRRRCRAAKEDAHRAAGNAGDALIYQLPAASAGFPRVRIFPERRGRPEIFRFRRRPEFSRSGRAEGNLFPRRG